MIDLPPAVARACNDCPWRRVSAAGWLGPLKAEEWAALALSEAPIACHQTIPDPRDTVDLEPEEVWATPSMRQCRGAAVFRANVAKYPRNPTDAANVVGADREVVFATRGEFVAHHERSRT